MAGKRVHGKLRAMSALESVDLSNQLSMISFFFFFLTLPGYLWLVWERWKMFHLGSSFAFSSLWFFVCLFFVFGVFCFFFNT